MVQLTIAHLTLSSLQPDSFHALNASLFHPSVYFPITHTHTHHSMVSSLKNSCLIFTPPYPALALASNIYTLFTSSSSPQVPFFQSGTTITFVTTHHTRPLYFSSIYGIRMPSQHSKPTRIHGSTIPKFIPRHHHDRNTSTFW